MVLHVGEDTIEIKNYRVLQVLVSLEQNREEWVLFFCVREKDALVSQSIWMMYFPADVFFLLFTVNVVKDKNSFFKRKVTVSATR